MLKKTHDSYQGSRRRKASAKCVFSQPGYFMGMLK